MNMDWALITSLSFNILFLLVILTQSNKINVLRREHRNRKLIPYENDDELIAKATEKLKTLGDVKAIKFVREETGICFNLCF